MPDTTQWNVTEADRRILRDLARRHVEIAHDPVMAERRAAWLARGALKPVRPMVLAETGGVRDEILPDEQLQCVEPWARGLERGFRMTIFRHESVRDDQVVAGRLRCNWRVAQGDYGVQAEKRFGQNDGKLASYKWDPPLADLDRDFHKLRPRTFSVDREATFAWKTFLEDLFDGILPVEIRGGFWWTMGLTWRAIELVGLQELMMLLYDNPAGLHRLMAFLRDDHLALGRWLEEQGLLSLNNEADSVGSGSMGFTPDLPARDRGEAEPVRRRDLWVLSESQETVGVSPEMFEEFIFPYQESIVREFGLCYYGCCEPVHSRWHVIRNLPNLRGVSVSPWADQEMLAEALGADYIYSRKPNPALISRERFDEDEILADLRHTLSVARGCVLEIIMKDVHTLAAQPHRLGRWVALARRAIDESL